MGKRFWRLRPAVQGVWTFLSNCYLTGFAEGKLYTGPLKNLCFPGLNCYSCPGALGACPVGALQAVTGSRKFGVSLYVGGFLMLVGALGGRFVCGWLCPFGWVQELLYRIPFVRKIGRFRADRPLRYVKYLILAVFVILLPLFAVDIIGQGSPAFCKYICPAGTLFGGIPLVAKTPALQAAIGFLFRWKVAILLVTALAAIVLYRPFCKYICPLGAIYALFNRVSLCRLQVDADKCTRCGACAKVCKMGVDPVREPCSGECIRCGECVRACPAGAIRLGVRARERRGGEKNAEKK